MELAPSIDEIRYVYELRAEKMNNPAMLSLGSSAIGKNYCETTINVSAEGNVKYCGTFGDNLIIGNVRHKNILDIWEENKEKLVCPKPKGPCAICANSSFCYGCRANAFYFTGDEKNSDPTCWLNPDARLVYEKYLRRP